MRREQDNAEPGMLEEQFTVSGENMEYVTAGKEQRRARTLAFRRVEVFTQVDIHFEPNCGRLISFSEDSIPHIGRKDKEKCA
ncbi:MAG: hypothetical protein IJ992_04690 [Lentisphaeria bacterium]|nr:hypothetical protein [Lentisphaeria bacterium]